MAADLTWTCPECGSSTVVSTHVCRNCGYSTDEEECCSGADVKKSSVAIVMLRWLAVLPAAFLGSAVIITVYDFLRPAVAAYGGVMLITDLLAVGGMGAYFVVAGAYVAPVKHIAVRATCASLYIAAVVYLVVVTSTSPDWVISPRWGGPHWMVYVQTAAAVVGSVIAVVSYDGD